VRSKTKRELTRTEIQALLQEALGREAELSGCEEFTDGWFSAVYGLRLADGRELVLKLAPAAGLTLLRYEFELMRTEISFYERAAAAGLPVPRIVSADPERGYLLMERLHGTPLATLKPALAAAELASSRAEIGRFAARLHGIAGPRFGYPRRDGRTQSASWSVSFMAFVEDVLADAVDFGTELPVAPERIAAVVRHHELLLDEVTRPSLVHFDLYDSNVFLLPNSALGAGDADGAGAGYAIEGVIDGERAFYGDPIAELVGLAYFSEPAEVPGLLPAYLGRELTVAERARLRLYTVYMLLIMLVEAKPRGFDPVEHEPVRQFALDRLEQELSALSKS
jgi:aminoglycoside phosphotransferase (APT) family kinase protein